MIVSWNWLKQYVLLDMPVDQLSERLMMAGLNHESTEEVGGDFAIDLEVTSNRPDCLGHLGIAREVATLWNRQIKLPAAQPRESGPPVATLTQIAVECPELCPRYTARVIRGVKIGPSPEWLVRRLATVGIRSINNVVDVTNYVLMECGQPLHAFDLAKLRGRRIIVRNAQAGEKFTAINHETYELSPGTCVIADAEQAVGLGGVMGGADSEVTESTTELLIESAEFDPLSIRNTARALDLRSDASYRFERGVDPVGVEWASRRCCELILEVAGGELAAGLIDVGRAPPARVPVVLRLSQISRILGIEIEAARVRQILSSLGLVERRADEREVEVLPPSWRRDLTREIDLIEEVARIHGYHHIPEDVVVPLAPSHRSEQDRVLDKVRHVLTALGYDEAITLSAVSEEVSESFTPWTNEAPLVAAQAVLLRANTLRRSLVPSLLSARRTNEALSNPVIELFEVAHVYLPRRGKLPIEPWMVGLCSGHDFQTVKGSIESLLNELNPALQLEARDTKQDLLSDRSAELWAGDKRLGFLGEVSKAGLARFDLRRPATVAELDLNVLIESAVLIPKYAKASQFPTSEQDLNFLVDEPVRWAELSGVVRTAAGTLLEELDFRELYRSEKLPAGKKKLLMRVVFRSREGTLTSAQVGTTREAIKTAARQQLGAELED